MIVTENYIKFNSLSDQLEYYKNHGFLAKSKNILPVLYYSGTYTDIPVPVEIIGYKDSNNCIIKILNTTHTITTDYLLQMQSNKQDILTILKNICMSVFDEMNILTSYFNFKVNKAQNNIDITSYGFHIGNNEIGKELIFRWYEKDKYFVINKNLICENELLDIFTQYDFTTDVCLSYSLYYNVINQDILVYLKNIVFKSISVFKSLHTYGCCSRYLSCSDEKKCLHPDLLYATGCIYRRNLENNLVFYGENANANNNYVNYIKNDCKNKSIIKKDDTYIVLDIETTGLSADDEIIEISAIKIKNNEVVNTFSSLVNPKQLISQKIISITGITNEMVQEAPDIKTILPQFIEFIGDNTLIGHNIKSFDIPFINRKCKKFSICTFENKLVDTLYLSKKQLNLCNNSLDSIANHFNIVNENAHRALSDCYTTWKCYIRLTENK